jgi:hypothetical protein
MNDIERAIKQFKEWEKDRWRLGKSPSIPTLILARQALEEKLNGGWIPVSERLPNNCGLGVLLTIANKFQQRKVIQGFTGYMEKGKLEFHTNDKTTNLEIWKVIAWQLLPPAYKEVENE